MSNLKIPADVVETIRQAIEPLDTEEVRDAYRAGNYPRADRTKDTDKALRSIVPPLSEAAYQQSGGDI